MFPSPVSVIPKKSWDTKGEFTSRNVNVSATTHKQRILKVGRKMELKDIIDQCAASSGKGADRDGMVLTDGTLLLYVFAKGSAAERDWLDKMRREREQASKQA